MLVMTVQFNWNWRLPCSYVNTVEDVIIKWVWPTESLQSEDLNRHYICVRKKAFPHKKNVQSFKGFLAEEKWLSSWKVSHCRRMLLPHSLPEIRWLTGGTGETPSLQAIYKPAGLGLGDSPSPSSRSHKLGDVAHTAQSPQAWEPGPGKPP